MLKELDAQTFEIKPSPSPPLVCPWLNSVASQRLPTAAAH